MEHVQRRGGRYFWRSRVPLDLAPILRRHEITRALDTACPRVARDRVAGLHAQVIGVWQEARVAAGSATAAELRTLVTALLNELDTVNGERQRAAGPRRTMLTTEAIRATADLAEDARADLPSLLRRIAEAEGASGKSARAAAVAASMDPAVFSQVRELLDGLGIRSTATPTLPASRFLMETYAPERMLREDAHRHVLGYVGLFIRAAGDKQLADYTRSDVIKWVRILEGLRTSYGKRKGDDTKTMPQLLKSSLGEATLSKTTIDKHTAHLKPFVSANRHFKWTSSEDIEDLFRDIPLSRSVPNAKLRKSWTITQLNELISIPIWSGTRSRRDALTRRHEPGPQIHRDAYWWLPIAALWTGARLEELAQLQHDDLALDRDGIPYLRIHDGGGRKVKTQNSVRNVPLHAFLVEIGFLALFRRAARGRIWPELKMHGRPPSWGALYSTNFTDYRRALGIYETLRDFHSLRRTFVTVLRTRAGVDPLTVAAIVGHDDGDPEFRRVQQTNDYTDYSIATLAAAIEKLDYSAYGLDLGALRYCSTPPI